MKRSTKIIIRRRGLARVEALLISRYDGSLKLKVTGKNASQARRMLQANRVELN
jgi:hypothetical protein